jgi:hypothetical protein
MGDPNGNWDDLEWTARKLWNEAVSLIPLDEKGNPLVDWRQSLASDVSRLPLDTLVDCIRDGAEGLAIALGSSLYEDLWCRTFDTERGYIDSVKSMACMGYPLACSFSEGRKTHVLFLVDDKSAFYPFEETGPGRYNIECPPGTIRGNENLLRIPPFPGLKWKQEPVINLARPNVSKEPRTFATIKKGKLRVWTPGQDGEEGTEETFERVNGLLTKIEYKTRDKTEKMQHAPHREVCLTLVDGDDRVVVSTAAKFGAGKAIQKMLPNIDPDAELDISVREGSFNGFTTTDVFFSQEGNSVKHFWKKDDMKDLPAAEPYEDRETGEQKWDTKAQVAYMEEYIMANVAPLFHEPVTAGSISQEPEENWADEEDAPPF